MKMVFEDVPIIHRGKTEYSSSIHWVRETRNLTWRPFVSRDGYFPVSIKLSKSGRYAVLDFAHEIGHILDCRYFSVGKIRTPRKRLRLELRAWRITKSFIRPEVWKNRNYENRAKFELSCYFDLRFSHEKANEIIAKLKIIPLNQGIKL